MTGRLRLFALTGLLLVLAALTGCLDIFLLPVSDSTSRPSYSVSTTTGRPVAPSPTPVATASPTLDLARSDAFDRKVSALIQAGLEARQKSIRLDAALEGYAVHEDKVKALVDHLHALFGDLVWSQPRFFYLDGSFQIRYTVRSDQSVAGMSLEPGYWDETAGMDDAELDSLIRSVSDVVRSIADEIRSRSSLPRQQFILLHDTLVRHIAYDMQGDQQNNQAASALLDRVTLCQGYAQSFQWIGHELGLDVSIVTGTADGIGHAWNQVVLNGRTYHVDVTHDDPAPDGGPDTPVRHVHLFRSDNQMSVTHQWDRDEVPSCPDDGAFYYQDQGLVFASAAELETELTRFVRQADLSSGKSVLFERFYTGQAPLTESAVEEIAQQALQELRTKQTIYYRAEWVKQVVLVQIGTGP